MFSFCHYLSLAKIGGKWRICYATTIFKANRAWIGPPITDCAAEVRVDAAPYVGKLHDKVIEAAEKFVAKAEEAAMLLHSFDV